MKSFVMAFSNSGTLELWSRLKETNLPPHIKHYGDTWSQLRPSWHDPSSGQMPVRDRAELIWSVTIAQCGSGLMDGRRRQRERVGPHLREMNRGWGRGHDWVRLHFWTPSRFHPSSDFSSACIPSIVQAVLATAAPGQLDSIWRVTKSSALIRLDFGVDRSSKWCVCCDSDM